MNRFSKGLSSSLGLANTLLTYSRPDIDTVDNLLGGEYFNTPRAWHSFRSLRFSTDACQHVLCNHWSYHFDLNNVTLVSNWRGVRLCRIYLRSYFLPRFCERTQGQHCTTSFLSHSCLNTLNDRDWMRFLGHLFTPTFPSPSLDWLLYERMESPNGSGKITNVAWTWRTGVLLHRLDPMNPHWYDGQSLLAYSY